MAQESHAAKAFVRAQSSFGPAIKASRNPAYKSLYADLGACIEAVMDALNMNGFALMQIPMRCESGVAIETVFLHESGERISGGVFWAPVSKNDAQGYGSATTYCRRYGLMAACGIAAEDDDGNAASGQAPKRPEPRQEQRQAPAPAPRPALQPLTEEASAAVKYALESWAAGDKDAVARSVKEVPAAEKTIAVQHIKASAGGNEMLAYLASLNARKEG